MSPIVNIVLAVSGTQAVLGSLTNVETALGGMATVANAAALASAAVVDGVSGIIAMGGELNSLSKRTGQSVRDLVVLERAYQNSGLASEYLAQSIGLVQRALGGTNEEGGKTDEVWKRLGLSQARLKQMAFADQLKEISTAFSRIQNPAERTATAMQLFGRSGAQMLQIIGDPGAFKTAEEESGRLADKMQDNARRFDEVGAKLTVLKVRLEELFLTVAERLVPALESAGSLLQSLNLSVVGGVMPEVLAAAGAIGGYKYASKFVAQLDAKMIEWSQKTPAAIAEITGGGLAQSIGQSMSPLTGALARVLPIGLALAVATQVLLGLHSAWSTWQNEKLERSNSALDSASKIRTQAQGIRSDSDRASVSNEAIAKIKQIKAMLADEESSWWTNDQAVTAYQTAIRSLTGTLDLLGSGWSKSQEAANQSADAAAAASAKFAAAEKNAKEWYMGDSRKSAQDQLGQLEYATMKPESQLLVAQTNLELHDKMALRQKTELEAAGGIYQLGKADIENQVQRLALLDQIKAASIAIADKKNQQARTDLELAQMKIDAHIAELDGDYAQADYEKWSKKRDLMRETLENAEKYLYTTMMIKSAATTPEARELAQGNVNSAKSSVNSALNALHGIGPDPTSYSEQMVSATASAMQQIGTLQQQVGKLWASTADSMRTSMGTAISDMILKTGGWRDKVAQFSLSVYTSFIQNTSQMVADWIMSHLVMANVRKIFEVSTTAVSAAGAGQRSVIAQGETIDYMGNVVARVESHAAGEGTKTSTSFFGTIARKGLMLAETIWHGIQIGVRTAAHVAGEVLKTVVTAAQWAIRLPLLLLETGYNLVLAAIKGMSAMASIPYVGPILAIAALAAIVAAGSSLMKKGFATGGDTGGSNPGRVAGVVHEQEWVAPAWMRKNPKYAGMIDWLESERTGNSRGSGNAADGYSLGGWVKKLLLPHTWITPKWNLAQKVGLPRWMDESLQFDSKNPFWTQSTTRYFRDNGLMASGKPPSTYAWNGSDWVQNTAGSAQPISAANAISDTYASTSGSSAISAASSSDSSASNSSSGQPAPVFNVALFTPDMQSQLKQYMQSRDGTKIIIDTVRGNISYIS